MAGGYETKLDQGRTNLFGGQKQRMEVARALVRRPDIYLFDDSFSALDFKTDANLRRALKEEVKDEYIVIVAKRVSSVMDDVRIFMLVNGEGKDKSSPFALYKMIIHVLD